MMFKNPSRPELESGPHRKRVLERLGEQGKLVSYAQPWENFPQLGQYKLDGGPPGIWQCPVVWGDSDMIAGKRKVNFVFMLLDHCLDILRDLASDDSAFRPYLEKVWAQDTGGKRVAFSPGLLKTAFGNIAADLEEKSRIPISRRLYRKYRTVEEGRFRTTMAMDSRYVHHGSQIVHRGG